MNTLILKDNKSNFFELDEKIVIQLENIKIPFGLENTNTILKCNLSSKQTTLINTIECKLQEKITDINSKYKLISQLIIKDKYPNQLITKIHYHKKKILTIFLNEENDISPYTILTKNRIYNVIIFLDKLWLNDDKFFYKWKIRKINIIK